MEHKIWYDENDQVVYLEFTRDYLRDDVSFVREKLFELFEGKPFRQLIVSIHKTAKVEDRETRQQSNQAMIDAKVEQVAFIGGSAANRMIAKVLLKTGTIKTQGEFFKDINSGLEWLINRRS